MDKLERAARALAEADALLITAGAGMGVDSGLPDFRGGQGFWGAYPPYKALNVSFMEISSPGWFKTDPTFAWGFYGHRRNLYRETEPHAGYDLLKRWADEKPGGYFVYTSNVDGAFRKAGFNESRIVESHGSIEWNQCYCGAGITRADDEMVEIDMKTMRASGTLPACPGCGKVTRPNIMMFGDPYWAKRRMEEQLWRFYCWLKEVRDRKVVIVECGAGVEIPSVRERSEEVAEEVNGTLVRINPNHADIPAGHLSIACGAREALEGIAQVR
jgi:NAD-dependent SIR2 family protein deacetylase